VDASNNVYITGQFSGTIDFDPGPGTHTLSTTTNSSLVSDVFVLKLDASGNYVWVKSFSGNNSNKGNALAIDASGYVYITGDFYGIVDFDPGAGVQNLQAVASDIFISKLNADGDYVWAKSLASPGNFGNDGSAIAADASGHVYLTGFFTGATDFDPGAGTVTLTPQTPQDVYYLKLDSSGNYIWAKQISGNPTLFTSGIAVNRDGTSVYATGWFKGTVDFDPAATGTQTLTSAGAEDVFITRLDSSGTYKWATRLGDVDSDFPSGIVVDQLNNLYTTGTFTGTVQADPGNTANNLTSNGDGDIYLLKLDAMGSYVWATHFGAAGYDAGAAIALANVDNVYLAGIFQGTVDFDPGADTHNLTAGTTGGFVVHFKPAASLPLTLLQFEAVDNKTAVLLKWQTSREENMDNFTIERSADGKQFAPIGTVAVNNSYNLVNNYTFNDASPLNGTNFYRLKINDLGGPYTYSRTIPVRRQANAAGLLVAPNPATNVLFVQLDAQEMVTLQIADVTGHVVYQQNKNITGNTTFPVSVQGLPAGSYYLIIKGKTIQKAQQFLKQ